MIRLYSRDRAAVLEIQSLARKFPQGKHLVVDGIFGRHTLQVIKAIQQDNNLIPDGIVGIKTWAVLLTKKDPDDTRKESKKYLSEADLNKAAKELSVDLATIKAVIEVESAGKGFIDNKPIILFEGHVFWDRLKAYNKKPEKITNHKNRDILYKSWTKQWYIGGIGEWKRLDKARIIHEKAALESASWGLFQIMGYHWKNLDYQSIKQFVKLMGVSEYNQLDAFIRFVRHKKIVTRLKEKDWAGFAYRYNGSGYKKNDYDGKLDRAYRKYSRSSK